MDLLTHLRNQNIPLDEAMELVERKQKNPALTGLCLRGRWVSFTLPSPIKFDEMIESGTPPGMSGTDRAFLEGTENNRQFQRQPKLGDFYKKEAAKHGKNIGGGDVYKHSLARFPGDPRAFVSGLGDAKRVIEQRQLEETKDEAKGPAPEVAVNPKIVARETARELAGQTVTGREVKDTMEKVRNRLKPSWKK